MRNIWEVFLKSGTLTDTDTATRAMNFTSDLTYIAIYHLAFYHANGIYRKEITFIIYKILDFMK